MPTSCVYLLYNSAGYCYIGQTTDIRQRLAGHRYNLKIDGVCSSKFLGPDYDYEILEELDAEDLHDAEKFYYEFWSELCPGMIVNRWTPGRTGLEYRAENRDEINARQRLYNAQNRDKINAKKKLRYTVNRDKISTKNKLRYAENRDEINARQILYYAQNRDKINAQKKLYRAENRDEINTKRKLYRAQKKQFN
jgi:hypothetical protein